MGWSVSAMGGHRRPERHLRQGATLIPFRIGNIVRDRLLLEDAKDDADELLGPRRFTREAAECIEYVRSLPKFGLAKIG